MAIPFHEVASEGPTFRVNTPDPRETVHGKGDGCQLLTMFGNGSVRDINTGNLHTISKTD